MFCPVSVSGRFFMPDLWDKYKQAIYRDRSEQNIDSLVEAVNAYRKWRCEFLQGE